MKPPARCHFLFSGYRQRWGQPDNGLALIYRTLRQRWPTDEIWWQPWHVDVRDLAMMCAGFARERHPQPLKITVAGYSFGGTTALNLCRELHLRGSQEVASVVLIDAVKRRCQWPLGWLAAFNRAARLVVPRNVRRATVFYQRQGWPRGHRVRVASTAATKIEYVQLFGPHSNCDDHPLVRDSVVMGAARTTL